MSEILKKLAYCVEFGKIDKTSPYPPDMKVDASFLSGKSEQQILEFFLDENGCETAAEMNRFRPIPQTYIDAVNPPDPNLQNYGYY